MAELRPNEIPLGKAQNLAIKKFGKVQPLYRIANTSGGIRWHCRCDCGKEFDAFANNLIRNRTKSCGCARAEKSNAKMIGKRFGKLVVLSRSGRKEPRRTFWICQCDCGNICEVRQDQLSRGVTTSCGCLKDLVGQTFGKLTVIRPSGVAESNNMKIWQCQCSCGNITYVRTGNLQSGHTTSCGCSNISKGEDKIAFLLRANDIPFVQQYIFDTCRFEDSSYPAKFDFYVNNSYLIEYDGSQHFEARDSGWNTTENLVKTQQRDKYKNQWAKQNHIPLIRIPYTRYKDLSILDLQVETSNFIIKDNYE